MWHYLSSDSCRIWIHTISLALTSSIRQTTVLHLCCFTKCCSQFQFAIFLYALILGWKHTNCFLYINKFPTLSSSKTLMSENIFCQMFSIWMTMALSKIKIWLTSLVSYILSTPPFTPHKLYKLTWNVGIVFLRNAVCKSNFHLTCNHFNNVMCSHLQCAHSVYIYYILNLFRMNRPLSKTLEPVLLYFVICNGINPYKLDWIHSFTVP